MGTGKAETEQLPIFPRYRVRGTEALHSTLQAAADASGRVTLNPDHRVVRRPDQDRDLVYAEQARNLAAGTYSRGTLFREIEAVPESDAMKDLYDTPMGDRRIETSYLAEMGIQALTGYVIQAWNPEDVHVVIHSSGYDSRILGGILRRLADMHGMDWLGETYFVCWQPEVAYWQRVMRYMEWPETMLAPVRPEAFCVDYYRDVLRFDVLKSASDVHRIWAGAALAVQELTERGVDVDRAVLVSAVFGDETGKMNRIQAPGTIGAFLACYFYDVPSAWPAAGPSAVLPFLSRPWLELLTRYKIPCQLDDFKLELLNILDPALTDVHRFPNYRFVAGPILSGKGYHPYQLLSQETVAEMERAVRESWYGQNVVRDNFKMSNVLYPYSEDGHLILKAAICEGLAERNISIEPA